MVEEVIDSPRGEDRLSVAHPEVAQVVSYLSISPVLIFIVCLQKSV